MWLRVRVRAELVMSPDEAPRIEDAEHLDASDMGVWQVAAALAFLLLLAAGSAGWALWTLGVRL